MRFPRYVSDFRQALSRREFLVTLMAAYLGLQTLARGAPAAAEYDVKAVFLFHLAAFVDWPDSALPSPSEPFVIAVLGEDPFGRGLEDIVRTETVRDRPFRIERYSAVQDVKTCQILFISSSEAARLPQILKALQHRPILSVSDMDKFALRGGMVGMDTKSGRIRLAVNMAAARGGGLTLSSKLLRLAERVEV